MCRRYFWTLLMGGGLLLLALVLVPLMTGWLATALQQVESLGLRNIALVRQGSTRPAQFDSGLQAFTWWSSSDDVLTSCQYDTYARREGIVSLHCTNLKGTWVATTIHLNEHVGNKNGSLYVPGAGFVDSCPHSRVNFGTHTIKLLASCRRLDKGNQDATLNLEPYLSNRNGGLIWR